MNLARSELQSEIDGQSASIATLSAAVVDLEGNAAATYSLRALAGTSGAELELVATDAPEGAASLARLSADNILLEGSVLVDHLAADVLSANNITAGTMSVARIEVDELLSIDAQAAGFSMDKITPFHDVDGLYMGRTVVPGGATGFGFAMSRYNTVSGLSESISGTSQYGLQIKNAQFYRDLASQPTAYTSTTSKTVNLAASVKTVQLSLIGGGGGGAAP
ncbi:hypothetical protein [Pseudophaeobacter flagellatus]|uniref:hypothetical protein n=1 Tax=Pseudophaeobacter flagellatus TaxID=2899119 RepID=UPI001E533EC1|nr:hypothetical protein [Pseudophaeobacter flagellatus]MCD9149090.1 hypothetical protein [Pseudophaeobacter flagellatus]